MPWHIPDTLWRKFADRLFSSEFCTGLFPSKMTIFKVATLSKPVGKSWRYLSLQLLFGFSKSMRVAMTDCKHLFMQIQRELHLIAYFSCTWNFMWSWCQWKKPVQNSEEKGLSVNSLQRLNNVCHSIMTRNLGRIISSILYICFI